MHINQSYYLSFVFLFICFLGQPLAGQQTFKLGTGNKTDVYFQFGNDLIRASEKLDFDHASFTNISTDGTVENLEKLRTGKLDVAIIQNDIGNYAYNEKHGHKLNQNFLAGIPLFSEYIQIVTARDGNVRLLGDLKLKIISIGSPESGSYWNAIDLLSSLGLKKGLDYRVSINNVNSALNAVKDKSVDAAIYTRASIPPALHSNDSDLKMLAIPKEIGRSLAMQKPYYHVTQIDEIPGDKKSSIATMSVVAYLVIGTHVSTDDALLIVNTVLGTREELEKNQATYKQVKLSSILKHPPFPFHSGAEQALKRAGYLPDSIPSYYLLLLLLVLYWLVQKAQRSCDSYDCLGNSDTRSSTIFHKLVRATANSGTYLYIIIIFSLVVVVQVLVTQYLDYQYARELNIESLFSDATFREALLWMFLFISSGHTGDVFPVSPVGQMIVGLMPLVGFMAILSFFYTMVDRRQKLRLARMRGSLVKNVYDHVLICGWNDKVPGLIYGLTSKDAPRKRQVVVIAELDDEIPFSKYTFDPHYVSYCRGDSANLDVLRKAQAENATDAVVVAGVKKQHNRNFGSILTILSLKEKFDESRVINGHKKTGLYVATEMAHSENKDVFLSCGADAVIPPDLVLNRLIVCSCYSDYIPDFILDILTHDAYSEIYTVKVNDMDRAENTSLLNRRNVLSSTSSIFRFGKNVKKGNKLQSSGYSIATLGDNLLTGGVNLIAVVKGGAGTSVSRGLVDTLMNKTSPFKLPFSEQDKSYLIQEEDSLIVLSSDLANVKSQVQTLCASNKIEQVNTIDWSLDKIGKRRVLIVGDGKRINDLRTIFRKLNTEVFYIAGSDCGIGHAENKVHVENLYLLDNWKKVTPWEYDNIIILSSEGRFKGNITATINHGDIDAQTILIARVLRGAITSFSPEKQRPVRIIAEMIDYKCRHLFEHAGVDIVVPRTVIVERMLTNLVYHHGQVCNFLVSMLAVEDGVFLRSIEIDESHDCCGMKLKSIFESTGNSVQLWGYLPIARRAELKNIQGDFGYHFLTVATGQYAEHCVESGDILIIAYSEITN